MVQSSAEQGTQVVVQPATTIVALVDDDSLAVAVLLVQHLAVDFAEACTVHGLDVDVSHLTTRETVYQLAVAVYPALVDERVQL